MAAGFITSAIFSEMHVGMHPTGEETCDICIKNANQYTCNCEKVYERNNGDITRYAPIIWFWLAFVALMIGWNTK